MKGRFGFDYVTNPERLTRPLIRKQGAPKGLNMDPRDPLTHFREAGWDEALAHISDARQREPLSADVADATLLRMIDLAGRLLARVNALA